jgi:hypothetical protein
VLAAGLLGGAGCRDLALPEPGGDGGVVLAGATQVVLEAPDLTRVQGLTGTFRFTLSDSNGLRGATLACGDVVLASWLLGGAEAQSLERKLDLTPCRPDALPEGGGEAEVPLVLQSVDATGVQQGHGPYRLRVAFPARGAEALPAELTLEHPLRVAPLSPIAVVVRAGAPLDGAPQVTVDGVAARVQEVEGTPLAGTVFRAELPAGLPLVRPTGDAPPDITSSERTVAVRVSARSAGGAGSQALSSLTLTHLRWARPLPHRLHDVADAWWERNPQAVEPVATAEGLLLAVTSSALPARPWVPVRLAAGSGSLELAPLSASTDWAPRAFDGAGRLLAEQLVDGGVPPDGGVRALVAFSAEADGGVPVAGIEPEQLVRLEDRLCRTETLFTPDPDGGFCPTGGPSRHVLSCVDGTGAVSRSEVAGSVGAFRDSIHKASSGGAFLALQHDWDTSCCPGCLSDGWVGTPGNLTYLTGLRDWQVQGFDRVLPDGAGGFAVVLDDMRRVERAGAQAPASGLASGMASGMASGLPEPQAVDLSESLARAYFVRADGGVSPDVAQVAGMNAGRLLGVAPGEVLVAVVQGALRPELVGYRAGVAAPVWRRELPGDFESTFEFAVEEEYLHTARFEADGSGVVLLHTLERESGQPSVWVVGLSAGLTPAWAHLHPLTTRAARLYPSPDGRTVYLVDLDNSTVTALAR